MNAILITKNKQYLLGYIDCLINFKAQNNIQRLEISENKLNEGDQETHNILGETYLDLTCNCGNYIAFKTADEIPDKSFKCTLCEETYMIYYTDKQI
jgi:hypothetical protein